jgi:hypothetical protein
MCCGEDILGPGVQGVEALILVGAFLHLMEEEKRRKELFFILVLHCLGVFSLICVGFLPLFCTCTNNVIRSM